MNRDYATARAEAQAKANAKALWVRLHRRILSLTAPNQERDMAAKIYLTKVRLNQRGYDSQGRFFGGCNDLYRVTYDGSNWSWNTYVRGATREEAKENVQSNWPSRPFPGFYR